MFFFLLCFASVHKLIAFNKSDVKRKEKKFYFIRTWLYISTPNPRLPHNLTEKKERKIKHIIKSEYQEHKCRKWRSNLYAIRCIIIFNFHNLEQREFRSGICCQKTIFVINYYSWFLKLYNGEMPSIVRGPNQINHFNVGFRKKLHKMFEMYLYWIFKLKWFKHMTHGRKLI